MVSLAGLLPGSLLTSSPAAEGPKRPNVVLIIAGELAREDCGAFGNTNARTPKIDRLAPADDADVRDRSRLEVVTSPRSRESPPDRVRSVVIIKLPRVQGLRRIYRWGPIQ